MCCFSAIGDDSSFLVKVLIRQCDEDLFTVCNTIVYRRYSYSEFLLVGGAGVKVQSHLEERKN